MFLCCVPAMSGDSVLGRPVLERALFLLKGEDLFSQSSPDSFCPLAIWAGVMRLAVISLTIGAVGSLCAAAMLSHAYART